MGVSTSYSGRKSAAPSSSTDITSCASSTPPSPPSVKTDELAHLTPSSAQCALTSSISPSLSVAKRLIATTAGTPNILTFSMCLSRLANPFTSAAWSGSSHSRTSSRQAPPCIFSARIDATMTAQSGPNPPWRHTMSKNFSAPRSVAKPPSVTTTSASLSAYLVAMSELLPCATLANGNP